MTDKKNHDDINHPQHYTSHPSGVEAIVICEHMTFNIGNVIKYLFRAGLKDNTPVLKDMLKARWYLDREIQRLEKLVPPARTSNVFP